MAADTVIFVSKRLQRAAAALICVMALQLLAAAVVQASPPSTPVVHVTIERQAGQPPSAPERS